jgi:hypothetical protein
MVRKARRRGGRKEDQEGGKGTRYQNKLTRTQGTNGARIVWPPMRDGTVRAIDFTPVPAAPSQKQRSP